MVAASRSTASSTLLLLQKSSIDPSSSSSTSDTEGSSSTSHHGILKLKAAAALGNGGGSSSSSSSSSSSASTLNGKTIPLTGLFAKRGHPSSETTPAIGTEFDRDSGLSLRRIIEDDDQEAIRELASLVSHRGVVFIRHQPDLTPDHLARLADKIGLLSGRPKSSGLHIHPLSSDFTESGEYIGKGEKIDSEPDASGRQISFEDQKSTFASAGWHTDISFEPVPSDYAMLQLRVIPQNGGGDTMWSSMYSAYDALSKPMQVMLEGLTATHDADMFREQAARYGFKLYSKARGHPDNTGDRLRTTHPVIRTNPVTGWKGLYVNRSFTKRVNELSPDESEVLLKFLFSLVAENFNYQCRFRWREHDIAIWDNRSTQHSGIFDFGKQKRTGDRVCSLGEKPYFDPASGSRKEQLAKSA